MREMGRGRRGGQAVEFALVLPVLLAVTAGIVDYGWYYSNAMALIYATREGGRAGAAHAEADGGTACATAESAALEALTEAGFSGATTSDVTGSVMVSPLTGEAVLDIQVLRPYAGLLRFVPTPSSMTGKMSIRLEDQTNDICSF